MVHMNEVDLREVKLEHLQKLRGSGYNFYCSSCGYMYKKTSEKCWECDSKTFSQTTELIRSLELNLQ